MTQKLPNVILITIDDLRADHTSVYGYPKNTTPNLERLAKKGILFEQAITMGGYTPMSFPQTLASALPPLKREDFTSYYRSKVNIAEVLKEKGYHTAAFVTNAHLSKFYHYDKGFDVFEDDFMGKTSMRVKRLKVILGPIKVIKLLYPIYRQLLNFYLFSLRRKLPHKTAEEINERAIPWVKQQSGRFFLWLHYMDVHPPYVPPATYLREFCPHSSRRKAFNLSGRRMTWRDDLMPAEKELMSNLYDACIKYADNAIGEFLDQVQEIQSSNNTLVVITADHGDELTKHPRGDFILYEGNLRVPLIIYYPRVGEGIVVKPQVSLIDLAPTIIDIIGGGAVPSFHGKSLLPVIRGEAPGRENVISMNLDLATEAKCFSCRTENWKLIVTEGEEDRLYNLQDDPEETVNLANKEEEVTGELRAKIQDYISFVEKGKEQFAAERLRQRIRILKGAGKI